MSGPENGSFPATKWSLVARVQSADEAVAHRALDELVRQYYYPLYCYIRRRGMAHHDAQDLLHDFLARLIRLDSLRTTEEAGGSLRGFLCKALQRFLSNWRRDHAGERLEASMQAAQEMTAAEGRFQSEQLRDEDTPEHIFDRKWAGELLAMVQRKLRAQYKGKAREAVFDALLPGLLAGGSLRGEDTPRIATALGMSEVAVRVAMSRLLQDYRQILRHEVAETVASPAQVDAEIAHLIRTFSEA